jgi:hypothetical protein
LKPTRATRHLLQQDFGEPKRAFSSAHQWIRRPAAALARGSSLHAAGQIDAEDRPNTSVTINYNTQLNTDANLGTITAAIGQSRRVVLSAKLRF